ncbi:hypothetical protein B0H13DRAFT_2001497 [Mycena leptocephala]|nr:hypothetical protein B0H13DRAFT_2001497 [Mycena leptocephala]
MPGSLFPRSVSTEPELPPRCPSAEPRQVRFAPNVVSPPTRSRHEAEHSADHYHRFHPSILLPSPKGKAKATVPEAHSPRFSAQEKGKGRAYDLEDADTSGEVRVRGKERELFAAREEQKRNEERRWERDKEKEKEDEAERARERERDKEKIRMLEEEILRLKNELSSRPYLGGRLPTTTPFAAARASLKQTGALPDEAPINPILPTRRQGQPTIGVPPDKMAAFLAEMKTVRLRKTNTSKSVPEPSSSWRSGSAGSTDSNTASIGGRSMLTGNAAILKKLGESISRSHSSTMSNKAAGDTSWIASRNTAWSRERSVVLDAAKTGEKENEGHTLKKIVRRSSSSSSSLQYPSSSVMSQSYPPSRQMVPRESTITPSLCSDKGREDDDDSDERLPSTPPAAAPASNPYMPVRKLFVPPPRKEKEIIDVDMDGRGHNTPPSPPRALAGSRRPPHSTTDVFAKRPPSSPMPADSPRKPRPPPRTPRAPPAPPPPEDQDEEEDELSLSFDTQDAPDLSPGDRPPPSKGKSKAVVSANGKPKTRAHAPPHLVPTRREKERTSVVPSTASTSSRGTATGRPKNRRRQTLDEEMRSAALERSRSRSYSRSSQQDREREAELDLESGTLVGVGTRPKNRGFLARGGAAANLCLWDEQDVDQDGEDGDGDYEPPPTGRRKATR